MAFRIVLIEKALRVRLDINNIVVNYENEDFWIHIDEIDTIVFDDPRCVVTLKLLSYLCEKGINVIFNDASHMPIGSLQTLYNNARSSKRLKEQINWDEFSTVYLWTEIVKKKIENQMLTLKKVGKMSKCELLKKMIAEVDYGDLNNKEGIASRVYFKELFGNNFKRFGEDIINYALNYVYQIIRSKISQEIIALGYTPSLGINHKSELNNFNLADDFIEVYRPICDYYVYEILNNSIEDYLTPEIKRKLVNILNYSIIFNSAKYEIKTSIQFYIISMITFLNHGDSSCIQFPKLLIL